MSEWISVEDRLPESGGRYLVILNNGQLCIAIWVAAYWAIGVDTISNVTHWMPLPEPPK